MKRPKTNSKLIVAFVMMLLVAYVILALALMHFYFPGSVSCASSTGAEYVSAAPAFNEIATPSASEISSQMIGCLVAA